MSTEGMEHETVDSIADDNSLPNELVSAQRQQLQQHALPVSLVGEDESKDVDAHQLQLEHHLAQLHKQHQQLLQRAQADQVLELQRAQLAHHIEQARAQELDVAAHLGLHGEDGSGELSTHEQEQHLLLQQQQLEAQIQQAAIAQHQAALAQHQLLAEGIPLAQPGLTDAPSR